jgi:hypothetical protein
MTVTLGRSSSDSHAVGRATLAEGAFCAVNRGATRMATASDKIAVDLTMSQAFYRSPDSDAKSPGPGDDAWLADDIPHKHKEDGPKAALFVASSVRP